MSNLLAIDIFKKFVSKRILYGGPNAVLYVKNIFDGSYGNSLYFILSIFFLCSILNFSFFSAYFLAFYILVSFKLTILFTECERIYFFLPIIIY